MSEELSAGLTPREAEVLSLLSAGRANKDIAKALSCSVRTVEFHISNLLRKANVSSRLALVARARGGQTLETPVDAPLVEIRLFAGVATAALGDALVVVWTTPATVERWSWYWARLEELMQREPAGALCLSLVLQSSSPPDGALRKRMQADVRRAGDRLRRFAVVPLGDSIWSTLVRAVGKAVLVLRGQSDRQAVVGSVDQGLSWLLDTATPLTPPRSEVERTITEMSRLLGVTIEIHPG